MRRTLIAILAFLPLISSCTATPTAAPRFEVATPSLTTTPTTTTTSIPTATSTATPTEIPLPTATVTREPTFAVTGLAQDQYPSARLANEVITQYAKAMNLKPESVVLKAVQLKDYQAKPFTVAVAQDSTPLLVQSKDGIWQKATFRTIGERVGIEFGAFVDISDTDWDGDLTNVPPYKLNPTSKYQRNERTIIDNFSLLVPGGVYREDRLAKYPTRPPEYFANLAKTNNMSLRMYTFYRKFYPSSLENATPAEMEKVMQDRVNYFLQFAQKGKKTEIIFANEAFDLSGGWDPSPYYRAFGKDWLKKAYLMFYDAAQQKGLEVGKDVVLMYGQCYPVELPGTVSDIVYSELRRMVQAIIKERGIDVVPLEMMFQFHMHYGAKDTRGWYTLSVGDLLSSKQKIVSNLKRFGEFGQVHVGEISIADTDDIGIKAETISKTIEYCIESGFCGSVTFYDPFKFGADAHWKPAIFDDDYSPTLAYFRALQALAMSGR